MTGSVATPRPHRRWWIAALLVAGTALVVATNGHDLVAASSAARRLDPAWGVLLILSSTVLLGAFVARHRVAQRTVGVDMPLAAVARAALAAQFVNSVSKSGGVAGVGAFTTEARRAGVSRARTVAAYLLVILFDQLALAVVLVGAVALLVADGHFRSTDVVAIGVFAVYLTITLVIALWATRSRSAVRAAYALPGRVAAWVSTTLLRRPRTHVPDTTQADELHDAFAVARSNGPASLRVLAPALAVDLVCVAQLWLALQALGVSTSPVVPLVSYAVATLFATVGFVPGGIGLVEVSTAAVLHSFGVPLGVALAAAVCARVAEFWIPLAVGAAVGHRYIATDSGVGV